MSANPTPEAKASNSTSRKRRRGSPKPANLAELFPAPCPHPTKIHNARSPDTLAIATAEMAVLTVEFHADRQNMWLSKRICFRSLGNDFRKIAAEPSKSPEAMKAKATLIRIALDDDPDNYIPGDAVCLLMASLCADVLGRG